MNDSPVTKVPTDFTKMHFDGAETTTFITCSSAAAAYAYKHFASPYSTEWRAAGAGYDAGTAVGPLDQAYLDEVSKVIADQRSEITHLKGLVQAWPIPCADAANISVWDTIAVGTPHKDSARVHTQCKLCDCLDGSHRDGCSNLK